MKQRTQHSERTKLVAINGRLHIVPMRRKRGHWVMQPPRLATSAEIEQAAADADFPSDFFEVLHWRETRHQEDRLAAQWFHSRHSEEVSR